MVDDAVAHICQIVADMKGWTYDQTRATTAENARRFLGSIGQGAHTEPSSAVPEAAQTSTDATDSSISSGTSTSTSTSTRIFAQGSTDVAITDGAHAASTTVAIGATANSAKETDHSYASLVGSMGLKQDDVLDEDACPLSREDQEEWAAIQALASSYDPSRKPTDQEQADLKAQKKRKKALVNSLDHAGKEYVKRIETQKKKLQNVQKAAVKKAAKAEAVRRAPQDGAKERQEKAEAKQRAVKMQETAAAAKRKKQTANAAQVCACAPACIYIHTHTQTWEGGWQIMCTL